MSGVVWWCLMHVWLCLEHVWCVSGLNNYMYIFMKSIAAIIHFRALKWCRCQKITNMRHGLVVSGACLVHVWWCLVVFGTCLVVYSSPSSPSVTQLNKHIKKTSVERMQTFCSLQETLREEICATNDMSS